MKLQQVLSVTRKAIDDYHMIEAGDKIAVGISGGKDSLTLYIPNLLKGLSDVSALFYDKAEGEWRIIPAEKVDTDAKTVTVTLTGSGTMTVIYRRK